MLGRTVVFFSEIKSVSCHFCGGNLHRCALIEKWR